MSQYTLKIEGEHEIAKVREAVANAAPNAECSIEGGETEAKGDEGGAEG